jgi:hypothetical protein
MTNAIDPRIGAEAKYVNLDAHEMHRKAVSEANTYDRPMSWMFWQWNKTFTSWERVRNHASRRVVEVA